MARATVPSDLTALSRLFELLDERARCWASLRKGDRLVRSSSEQLVAHPLYRRVSMLDAEIRQLEDRFGMTPAARARRGLSLDEARRRMNRTSKIPPMTTTSAAGRTKILAQGSTVPRAEAPRRAPGPFGSLAGRYGCLPMEWSVSVEVPA